MWKPSLTPVRILFGDRLWVGLPASKLQFNAQETTGYAFFFFFFLRQLYRTVCSDVGVLYIEHCWIILCYLSLERVNIGITGPQEIY